MLQNQDVSNGSIASKASVKNGAMPSQETPTPSELKTGAFHDKNEDKSHVNGDINQDACQSKPPDVRPKNGVKINGVTNQHIPDYRDNPSLIGCNFENLSISESSGCLPSSDSGQPHTDNSETMIEIEDPPSIPENDPLQDPLPSNIEILEYKDESDLPEIMGLITKDLSEPYSIYTYRYFIHNWPQLCFKARLKDSGEVIGAIVCKLDTHQRSLTRRGYIAMLAVHQAHRRLRLASHLVSTAILAMIKMSCDEVVLETEVTNSAALKLYEKFGFVRDKRLHKYYLNGVDAFRLKLWLT